MKIHKVNDADMLKILALLKAAKNLASVTKPKYISYDLAMAMRDCVDAYDKVYAIKLMKEKYDEKYYEIEEDEDEG